jgi:uncharacterized membrane protein YeaQ/YmgE (transglycosylase-associated protein family)
MTANGILSAILIGILVGTLGRLILPGRQNIGVISTIAIGIGAALLGSWAARAMEVQDRWPAAFNADWAKVHLRWSWAELGIQVLVAVIGIGLAAALTNTAVARSDRPRRRRKTRSSSS